MSNTNQPGTLFRYWLSRFTDAIRIEFSVAGVPHAAELNASGSVTHATADVPPALALAARDCLDASVDRDIPACEFAGYESQDEMFRQVAARCVCCGSVQASPDWLSRDGECGRCHVGRMAVAL